MIAETLTQQPTIERTTFYMLPKFLSQIQHITTIDSGGLEFVICCDKMKLYIFPLIAGGNKPLGNIHQSLPIPNIKSLKTIAKNYLVIETQNRYIGIFQIIKSLAKQQTQKSHTSLQINAVKVQFSEVLKWRIFSSYFIRQVMENLFEVQVFFNDVEFEIFQFTSKNKRGSMSFTISLNGKIMKSNKKQLYGSKCFFNIGRKLMYWLKNFSDKQFVIQQLSIQPPVGSFEGNKILNEPFAYFGVQRSEQYKQIYPNMMIRDCIIPSKRFGLKLDKESFLNELKGQITLLTPSKKKQVGQENPYNDLVQQSTCMENITQILQSLKISTFTDLLMVENKVKKEVQIYQIKGDGAELIGKETSHVLPPIQSKDKQSNIENGQKPSFELRRWEWHFGNSKKLIAIDKLGFQLKYIQQIALEIKQQNIIQAELVNMNEKNQQPNELAQNKPNKNHQQIQPQKKEQQEDNIQIKNQVLQEEKEPKRKFSKDQLQKFCHQFKSEDAHKYVSQQLIKKVDQVNNWTKNQVLRNQKTSQNVKAINFKSKNNPEPMSAKNQCSQKTCQPQHKNSPKQQKSGIQERKKDKIKQQNVAIAAQQGISPKQKPPMKIIQRNKISVAKNFQTTIQSKPSQEQKNELAKKETQKLKDEVQKQKNPTKTQNQPNQFTKFRVKDQSAQNVPQEKDKKRFMKNYLGQERKQQSNEIISRQVEANPFEKQSTPKNDIIQKQEKVKFNVITRASLLRKKQTETPENKQIKKQQIQSVAQPVAQTDPIKTNDSQLVTQVQNLQPKQVKQQNPTISEQPKSEKINLQTAKDNQSQPKTKFVPSIDIGKASKIHLNDCDFLSEDSLSNQAKDEKNTKDPAPNDQNKNDQSIQEQIDGDDNDQAQPKDQADKEYLIDDDINVGKPQKVSQKVETQQKLVQINQDQDIQKFCYNLLDDQSEPKYQLKQSQQSQDLKSNTKKLHKVDENPSLNSTPSFKLENSGESAVKKLQNVNEIIQEEQDEMKKLSSLLFKTSIKRTNIFSTQNQENQDKMQQNNSLQESKEKLNNSLKSPKKDPIKEDKVESIISNQGELSAKNPKQTPSADPINKRSNDWHGSSSESSNEENEAIEKENPTPNYQKPPQQAAHKNQAQQKQIPQSLNKSIVMPTECPQTYISPKQSSPSQAQSQQIQNQNKASNNQQTHNNEKLLANQTRKNPFIESINSVSEKNPRPIILDSNIFKSHSESFFNQSIPLASNSSGNLSSNQVSANFFTSFKKNNLPAPLPLTNIFSTPPPNVIGGSNPNMFKKFLSQREQKKIEEHKKQEQKKPFKSNQSEIKQPEITAQEPVCQKAQFKQKQRKVSQGKVISTSALPQIQQMISKYEQSTIDLLQEQQKTIIKSLQQIPHTHNPYNKKNSLLLPEQIKQEIIKQSKQSVKKWLSTKMLDKVEVSFREIMHEQKTVYEQALKFYENEARKKITTMQLQYEQQSSILMDIQNVSANMCAALQSSILQGQELHTYQLKQWKKQIQQAQTNMIDPLITRIDDSKTFFQSRNQKLSEMTNELKQIKQILQQKLRQKQQIKELKQKKKIEKQQKLKLKIQQQAKLQILKIKEQIKKSTKKRKNFDQNQAHVSFYSHAPHRQNEPQLYPRQPYAYY